MKTLIRQLRIFWHCPEIRGNMMAALMYLVIRLIVMIIAVPFVVLMFFIQLVDGFFDDIFDKTFGRLLAWLVDKRAGSVKSGHTKVSTEEIQNRIDGDS
jgi:hypothetical protein